ncbi:MAG: biotin--[acetyl-CoA-carboxylase] ligase [Phycisphaerae bacterium]
MSTTSPMTEATVTRVLLAMWRHGRGGGGTTLQQVLRETLAPLPDVQEALGILRQRGCLIEATPTSLELVSTGLACWRDVLEGVAKEKKLRVGRRVMVYLKTTSTNDVAWQCAGGEDSDGLVVVADEQTAGRGRQGHQWAAKAGQSVLMSVVLSGVEGEGDTLTLLAGLAAAKGLESLFPAGARMEIKWPNDLLHEGRKVGGILVERRNGNAVVGIGVNVNQAAGDLPAELAGRAASLLQVTGGARVDRARVMAAVIEQLNRYVVAAPETEVWLGEWKARCPLLNQRVTVRAGERLMTGQILDIDPLRGLILRDDGGATHFLSAQTTTLSV